MENKRCQHCRRITGEGPRQIAIGVTKAGHLICEGCASWYGLEYGPLWSIGIALKDEGKDLPKNIEPSQKTE